MCFFTNSATVLKNALATKGRFVVEGNDGRKHSYLSTKTKLDIPKIDLQHISHISISLRHRTDGYSLGRYQIPEILNARIFSTTS